MFPVMKKTPSTGAGYRYIAPYAELCAFEAATFIAQSGSTEEIIVDDTVYNW
jgi:hypothetical protein